MRKTIRIMTMLCVSAMLLPVMACGQQNTTQSNASTQEQAAFDASTPAKAAENYLKALAKGDVKTALKYVTPSERPEGEPAPTEIGSKAKQRITDISIGEAENNGDGNPVVPFSYKAAGQTKEGKWSTVSSPEGGYRISSDGDSNALYPLDELEYACGGMKKGAVLAPGVYDMTCKADWGSVDQSLAISGPGEPEYSYSNLKVSDMDSLSACISKILSFSIVDKFYRSGTGLKADYNGNAVTATVKSAKQIRQWPEFAAVDASGTATYTNNGEPRTKQFPVDRPGTFVIRISAMIDDGNGIASFVTDANNIPSQNGGIGLSYQDEWPIIEYHDDGSSLLYM